MESAGCSYPHDRQLYYVGASGVTALHQLQHVSGRYKAENHPYAPLSEEALALMQEMVDDNYDQFTESVARHRGVSPKAVRAGYGEGRVLTARRAVVEDLVDRVCTLDELGAIGPADARTRADELPHGNVGEDRHVVRIGAEPPALAG